MNKNTINGAGLRGQVAGQTSLCTVGKTGLWTDLQRARYINPCRESEIRGSCLPFALWKITKSRAIG